MTLLSGDLAAGRAMPAKRLRPEIARHYSAAKLSKLIEAANRV